MPSSFVSFPVTIDSWFRVHAFVDSGATISLISSTLVNESKLALDTSSKTTFNQLLGNLHSIGRCHFTLTIGSRSMPVTVDVIEGLSYPFLLGLDISSRFGIITDLATGHAYLKEQQPITDTTKILQQPSQPTAVSVTTTGPPVQGFLKHIFKTYDSVFAQSDSDLGTITVSQHKIPTIHDRPINKPSFRQSLKYHDIVRNKVKHLDGQGQVRPSVSPYNSPVFLVPKKDGSMRMVLDYRAINAITIDNRQPLPLVQDVMDRLRNKRIFSVLDIAWGFWQIPMAPEDIAKTAFSTIDGHYEWVCMPMGLKGAPATFQRVIQTVLGDLLFNCVINYMDDLIIYSDTESDHMIHLEKVLGTLQKAGVKLKKSKCFFFQEQVEYLGFLISHNTIKPSPSKIDAVKKFPRPQTKRDVQRFLGLCNYLRRHIPNYTEKGHHLMALTGDKPFLWTPQCEENFEELKAALSSESCLAIYDPNLVTELHTDASKVGIGAMLIQRNQSRVEESDTCTSNHCGSDTKPIAYYSLKLSDAQSRWSATELEAFAVKEACLHFKPYLSNGHFTIFTDHAALTWAKKNPQNKGKLHRWFIELSEFDYTIVHRKGKLNQHVDALSRAPSDTEWSPVSPSGQGLDTTNEVLLVAPNPITRQTIIENQSTFDISSIRHPIQKDGVWHVEVNGHLRVIVPPDLRQQILEHFHDDYGHPGTGKTLLLLRNHFWWPNYTQDTSTYVKACQSCILVKSRNHPTAGPLVPLESPTQPFEIFGIDTIILGRSAASTAKKVIINFVDHFSRFVFAFACKDNSSATLINCLDTIIKATGKKPSCVVTDQGTNYVSKQFRRYLDDKSIKWKVSSSYHPQTNGMVEKMNHTLIVRLRIKCYNRKNLKWSSLLPDVVSELNATPHEVTKFSPEYLMYGTGQPCDFDGNRIPLEEARTLAFQRTKAFQQQRKESYDRKHHPLILDPGDLVVVETAGNHPDLKKLDPRFNGQYEIVTKTGPNTYKLRDLVTGNQQIFNSSRLRLLKKHCDAQILTRGE